MLHVALVTAFAFVQEPPQDKTGRIQEGLKAAEWLVGAWSGAAKGGMGEATGGESWEKILDGTFLQSKEKWTQGDKVVHNATSLMTYDVDRGRLVIHHIDWQGSYHFYVGTVGQDATTWTFNEPYKDHMKTRWTIKKLSDTETSGRFEVQDEHDEWKELVSWTMKKS